VRIRDYLREEAGVRSGACEPKVSDGMAHNVKERRDYEGTGADNGFGFGFGFGFGVGESVAVVGEEPKSQEGLRPEAEGGGFKALSRRNYL
jgi:hypothetical protein